MGEETSLLLDRWWKSLKCVLKQVRLPSCGRLDVEVGGGKRLSRSEYVRKESDGCEDKYDNRLSPHPLVSDRSVCDVTACVICLLFNTFTQLTDRLVVVLPFRELDLYGAWIYIYTLPEILSLVICCFPHFASTHV